jgi:diacylglycerol O-acyltransferase / wax synthase
MLTKIHHALVDGMSGNEIMGLLLDLGPEGRELPEAPPSNGERPPGELEMLGRGLLGLPRYPVRLLRSLPATLPNVEEAPALFGAIPGAGTVGRIAGAVQRAVTGDGPAPERSKLVAPRTSFTGRVSAPRRFAFGQLSLAEVKAMKNEYGSTVNDVVVSMCAGAVRRWLLEHDELPDEPLVAQVPVSVRGPDQAGTFGNRILLMSVPLFTDELTFRPSGSRPGRPTWNLVISNVPGPQFPLYCAGARLEANYPVSVITDGMGLNITVMSYCGHLDFGIVADRDQMADVACLIEQLGDELEALKPV